MWLLRGECRLVQGSDVAICQEAVFWIEHAAAGSHQRIESRPPTWKATSLSVWSAIASRWKSTTRNGSAASITLRDVQVRAGVVAGKPNVLPGIYQRGMDRATRSSPTPCGRPAWTRSSTSPRNELPPPGQPSPAAGPLPPGTPAIPPGSRRIRVFARGDVPMQAQWQQDPRTNQAIAVINQGVTMVIEGMTVRKGNIPGVGGGPLTLDLSTDRLVIWTVAAPAQQPDINAPLAQDENKPLEVYMEGNVVFRQGDRDHLCRPHVLRRAEPRGHGAGGRHAHAGAGLRRQGPPARRHHAADRRGPLPRPGRVRHLQPHGNSRLSPANGRRPSSTTSRPRSSIGWGNPVMDPKTGLPAVNHQELVAAQNNLLYIEERADLLLADVRHGPERSVVLHPPHTSPRTTAFSATSSIPIGPPTSCWASRTARWEPIGRVSLNYLSLPRPVGRHGVRV